MFGGVNLEDLLGGGMGGGFGGMGGGMPGGHNHGPPSDGGESGGGDENPNELYERLGIEKSASQQQIKKAYRKLARELHPDKHPEDPETYDAKFKELQEAYEILKDPDKRKLYDRYGMEGITGRGGTASGMDIFDMFFGGGGGGRGGRGGQRQRKAPTIKVALDVTLEDFYLGSSKPLSFSRFQLCQPCNGKGGKKVQQCRDCDGRGVQIVMQRMGFMTMQSQRPCANCRGEGTSIAEKDKCRHCDGKGMKKQERTIDFQVPMGAKHAAHVTLRGMGHEVPDASNGDVVVIMRSEKHDTFQRIGADLAMSHKLSLKEALCGYDIKIPHLSRSILHLRSAPGEIVQPGQLKRVYSKGMPQRGSPQVFGHLYIKFEVEMPKTLEPQAVAALAQVLPDQRFEDDIKTDHLEDPDSDDEVDQFIEHVEAETLEGDEPPDVTPASARSTYDEDEEEQQGPGCRQM